MSVFKCRRCRCTLFKDHSLLTSHGVPVMEDSPDKSASGECDRLSTVWYISTEDSCPEWVTRCINKGEWRKGKLLCPKCRGRLGSFDFTSSQKCPCGAEICPPIHVNKNRVDCFSEKDTRKNIKASQPGTTDSKGPNSGAEQKLTMNGVTSLPNANSNVPEQTGVQVRSCSGYSAKDAETDGRESRVQTVDLSAHQKLTTTTTTTTNCEQSNHCIRMSNTVVVDHLRVSNAKQNAEISTNSAQPASTANSGRGPQDAAHNFTSKRKSRHKRVASDCSWLRNKQQFDFVTMPNNTRSSDSLNSMPTSEDSQSRHHGNRNVSLSTSLLRKRYGHRRAQSMTVTSNRFEFLQEDADSLSVPHSAGRVQELRKPQLGRPASVEEVADPPVPEEFICPVCLDIYCNPHSCLPCRHSFCEVCLRQLARSQPEKTSCPMCRQVIVQCQPQHHISFLLKTTYPNHYSRRRKAFKKQHGKLHPLPKLKADLRHKLGVVMQNRLRGRRLREICRDHFIMTFFVYTGAVALLLGVFLLLILVCCKSLFFLFLLLQWFAYAVMRCASGAADLAVTISPSLITTTTDAAAANRVILSVIALATVYKLWTGVWSRDRAAGRL